CRGATATTARCHGGTAMGQRGGEMGHGWIAGARSHSGHARSAHPSDVALRPELPCPENDSGGSTRPRPGEGDSDLHFSSSRPANSGPEFSLFGPCPARLYAWREPGFAPLGGRIHA